MLHPFMNADVGVPLRKVSGATGNALAAPATTVIPNEGYTEIVNGHDGEELTFWFVFAAAATGDVVIERCPTNGAAVSEEHETITVAGSRCISWAAGETLVGFYRVKNETDQNVVVNHNNRISSRRM